MTTVDSASTPTPSLPTTTPPPPPELRQLPTHVATAVAGTAIVLAGVLMLVHEDAWWRGYMAALVITAVAAIASLPPLIWGVRYGLTRAVACYFVSAGLRVIICLIGCAIAIRKADYPRTPTLLMLVAFYFVLLVVESASLARAIWSAKA